MVTSDRHHIISTIANVVYNDNGGMEGTILDDKDVEEIYQHLVETLPIMGERIPTREEVEISLFQVMGAFPDVILVNRLTRKELHAVRMLVESFLSGSINNQAQTYQREGMYEQLREKLKYISWRI